MPRNTTLNSRESKKHLMVRDAIAEAIRSGEFAAGARLPSEPELAKRFGVSYMTARRGVTEMVEADLLERRPNEGTFVRAHSHRHLATVTVNLIYPPYQSSIIEQFLSYSIAGLESRGWRHHVIHLQNERERPAIRALESGEPSLIMSPDQGIDFQLSRALSRAKGRAVLIGNHLEGSNVPSVMADDEQAIRLLVEYLQASGHRAIGLVSNHPDHSIDQVQVRTWKACCASYATPEQLSNRLIFVDAPRASTLVDVTFEKVRSYLLSPQADVTAFICLKDDMVLATIAACRDVNLPVPERISIVKSGNNPVLRYYNPPVTCVDIHLERHVEIALEILEANLNGQPTSQFVNLVTPTLVVRESVAPLKASAIPDMS